MSQLTKGTQVYFIDPDAEVGQEVVKIPGLTQFNPGGSPAGQVDDTDLEDEAMRYKKGMPTPGQASGSVKADPSIDAHIRLAELADEETERNIQFIVGWADGKNIAPVVTSGALKLPNTRTWYIFEGYVADFPFDFAINAVVQTALSIQRSGKGQWKRKGRPADEYTPA
ncbi:phage tail protein [Rheinheimera mesophila]|jgi:hypothetical protein|uniref:Phage tail protein n=1 Tax=Rheinheimera mesophila TaxID=1547515 RepID=A0A3P3QQ20_9GAMM|nr:phage tail tube protein [Rheinheimera mesophila]KKL00244.1 hypothetical protein SD53_15695 [Rheinheimera mesophila]RRJ22589.1 phage tail protein [Rheinheimera mesophila]